jgi:CheY-like chemotaxis protein
VAIQVQLSCEVGREAQENTMLTKREFYRPLILCVDDDEGILDLLRMALEDKGYRVLTANNGPTALEAFAACPVDAVVLDYEMPGMNGGEVAREMMRIKPKVPKLLFSGNMSLSQDLATVFQGYCSKPNGLFTLTSQIGAMTSLPRSA